MSSRLQHHFPTPSPEKDFDSIEQQRIYDQNQLQDNVSIIFDDLASKEFLGGFLIETQTIGVTETLVNHKLGRAARGWYIVRKDGAGDVYDLIGTSTADLSKHLPLISDTSVIISLVVF